MHVLFPKNCHLLYFSVIKFLRLPSSVPFQSRVMAGPTLTPAPAAPGQSMTDVSRDAAHSTESSAPTASIAASLAAAFDISPCAHGLSPADALGQYPNGFVYTPDGSVFSVDNLLANALAPQQAPAPPAPAVAQGIPLAAPADPASAAEDETCILLIENPFGGAVVRHNACYELKARVICDWIAAGGPEVLRRTKPNVIDQAQHHWVSMPRSILKKYDATLVAPGGCSFKIVAMYIQVFKVIGYS